MKKLLGLFFLLSAAFFAYAQPGPYKVIVVSYDTLNLKTIKSNTPLKFRAQGTQLVIMELPTAHDQYDVTMSAVKVIKYDTIHNIEYVDDANARVVGVNITKVPAAATNNKPGVYANTFAFVSDKTKIATVSLTFTGSGIEWWSERFNQPGNVHGRVMITIDGVTQNGGQPFDQSLAPLTTDFLRGQPTFKRTGLNPVGTHTIVITGAIGQQFVTDRFAVLSYTLQPKP